MSTTAISPPVPARLLRISLWVAQALLFFVYASAGLVKFFTPIPQLAAMMPWTGEHSETLVRAIGLIDLADKLDQAIANVLAKGIRTGDIKSEGSTVVSTSQMGEAILKEVQALHA